MKEKLARFIAQKSYREGDFTLASGKKSPFYIDLKATTLHPEGAWLIGRLAVQTIKDAGLVVDAVGGMTLGADPIATAVSLVARDEAILWPAFIVRKEPKGHGTARYIEGTENLTAGARLLVVEDVATTGGSSLRAVERLREAGYNPVAVLAVVDRDEGARTAFEAAGLVFFALATLEEIKNAANKQESIPA